MLQDNRRKQLDDIVSKMSSSGESDANIQFVVDDFKSKYAHEQTPVVTPSKGLLQKTGEFISETTGFTGVTKAVVGGLIGGKVADSLGNKITTNVNELISKAKALPAGSPERRKLLEQALSFSERGQRNAEGLTGDLPTTKQAVGSAGKLGLTAATFGAGTPVTVAGRIAAGAGYGAGFGGANAMEQDKGVGDIAKESLIGGVIGGAIPAAIEGVKWAVKGVPKLLSYTSNTPDEVLQRQYDNPELGLKTLQNVKKIGPEGVMGEINTATRKLRTDLSQQWKEGAQKLINENQGVRTKFASNELKILNKIADDFGIDLPQNMTNISLKEGLELNKALNELYSKRAIREGAEGVIVRKGKDLVSGKLAGFSGIKQFLKNYSDEKQVLDAVVDIIKPYSDNPVTKNTALSRVKAIFADNKPAFLSAMKDLEIATGLPITDKAAVLNLLQKSPITGKSLPSQLIELLMFPITSPRTAGVITRAAGRIGQSKASQVTRNTVSEGIRKLLR